MNYYNEFDPKAAQWLRNLIAAGLIPPGDVDERSITEVKADDLKGYTQCHFFAGIGGWSYALQLAGWPADRPVWTGSCPCQPFSTAGNRKGKQDERHLWPVWLELIRECRPPVVFGEQVASAVAHGWLDDVYQGLENEGYACGSAVLPACGVGAPHKRDRLFFVANAEREQTYQKQHRSSEDERERITDMPGGCGVDNFKSSLADACNNGCDQGRCSIPATGSNGAIGNGGAMADAINTRSQGHAGNEQDGHEPGRLNAKQDGSAWESVIWIDCPDGKQRLVEPSIRLLANGVSNRVGKLRGYGNAIVPQVAAEFIAAFDETL